MANRSRANDKVDETVTARSGFKTRSLAHGFAEFTHRDRYGQVIDRWTEHNLIVNGGLDAYLDARLKGNSSVALSTWFMGLILGDSTFVAANLNSTDTATNAAWSESTHYSEATRVKWESGAVSGQSVSNSTSTGKTFSINTSTTVGGCFMISVGTKGNAGTTDETGVLHSEIAFSQTRSLSSGDTLDVTYTHTMAFSST